MSISKKKNWKKGTYSFTFKMFRPDGSMLEVDCEDVYESKGKAVADGVFKILMPVAKSVSEMS